MTSSVKALASTGLMVVALAVAGQSPTSAIESPQHALSAHDIDEAIDWGRSGEPQPYLLRHIGDSPHHPNPVVVGAVYTPFLRVALAAQDAWRRGQMFTVADVDETLLEPSIYVAFRWYCCDRDHPSPDSFRPFDPPDHQVALVPRTTHSPTPRELASAERPLWIRRDISLLDRFGGGLPFSDVVLIAAFPLNALTADHHFVIYRTGSADRLPRIDEGASPKWGTLRIGAIRAEELRWWR